MNEGPHYPMTIMPLVEENRRLHEENQLLKLELEAQAVRWDQWLDMNVSPNLREALVNVRVDVSQVEFLSTYHTDRLIANKLLDALFTTHKQGLRLLRPHPTTGNFADHSSHSYTFSFLGFRP